jgi:hypothetical protein
VIVVAKRTTVGVPIKTFPGEAMPVIVGVAARNQTPAHTTAIRTTDATKSTFFIGFWLKAIRKE